MNDSIVILGGGFIGCVAAALCRKRGAGRIVVVESSPMRRKIATEMGADVCLDFLDEQFQLKMLETVNFEGFDVILETGYDSELFHRSVEYIARGGRIGVMTCYRMDENIILSSSGFYHANASLMSSCLSNNKYDIAAVLVGQMNFSRLLQAEYPFDQAFQAFEEMKKMNLIRIGITL